MLASILSSLPSSPHPSADILETKGCDKFDQIDGYMQKMSLFLAFEDASHYRAVKECAKAGPWPPDASGVEFDSQLQDVNYLK